MTTINEILYANYLDIHILEKKILLSNLLNTSKEELNLATQNKLSDNIVENFNSLILRRRKNEPISYLTNIREFWKYEFYINESVLIPRHDSEIIIETVPIKVSTNDPIKIIFVSKLRSTLNLRNPLWPRIFL